MLHMSQNEIYLLFVAIITDNTIIMWYNGCVLRGTNNKRLTEVNKMYNKLTAPNMRNYGRIEHFKDENGNNNFCSTIYAWRDGKCIGISAAHLFDDTLVITNTINKDIADISIIKGIKL